MDRVSKFKEVYGNIGKGRRGSKNNRAFHKKDLISLWMIFTLIGDVYVGDEHIKEKTAAKLSEGDSLTIKNADSKSQVLFISSDKLNEDVAWAGPIVMNTSKEIRQAYLDLRNGTFIKDKIEFNAD